MHEIVLIEDSCCHAGECDDFLDHLADQFEGRAVVKKYGVGGPLGFSEVPVDLAKRLLSQGAQALPVVALDGELVFQGALPDEEGAAVALEQRMAAGSPTASGR